MVLSALKNSFALRFIATDCSYYMYNVTVVTLCNIYTFQKIDLFILFPNRFLHHGQRLCQYHSVRIGSLTNASYSEAKSNLKWQSYINIHITELSANYDKPTLLIRFYFILLWSWRRKSTDTFCWSLLFFPELLFHWRK